MMNFACTTYVQIHESDFSAVDADEETPARIIKTDGTTHVVRRFEITGDSIIIHEF